ncbi:MAG: RagB/SusD family nutrient uptake outer membrane protein, partial [Bacteroidetes bacterium]|nr:RagB/SusD family nutrient uptake outer membrane protein [Bacteroidota bacterium]
GQCLADLNTLLRNRYTSFIPYSSLSQQDALQLVWKEQRKELLFRGLRWAQLKRLNSAGAGILLQRSLNGQPYQLAPGDKKYVLPVPLSALNGNTIVQWSRD